MFNSKNNNDGYLPAISTRHTTESAAIEVSFKWLREGKPLKNYGTINIGLHETLKNIKTDEEADFICKELKKKGFLKTYVIAKSKQDINFPAYLQNFWDFDSSPYVKECLRKNHGIHRYYCRIMLLDTKRYWIPYFKDQFLGAITRENIEAFINEIGERCLSAKRKNSIIRSGTIPIKWAFSKKIIDKDVTSGITWFSGKEAERQILTPEIVQMLFHIEWPDERSRLANMLAAVTGLRAGEIQGLRVQDLGKNCLYIRHSWNCRDGLKTTKNNEIRTVEIPFPSLINDLISLAKNNPHGAGINSYIFWAEKLPSKPMENCLDRKSVV
jgi:hypothetical protein